MTVARIVFGNHSSVIVPLRDRDSVRKFYCDVLGGTLTKADPERDFVRLGGDFYAPAEGPTRPPQSSHEALEPAQQPWAKAS